MSVTKIKNILKKADHLGIYESHVKPMIVYAKRLAIIEGEDEEMVEIACLLHDYGKLKEGKENHHISGAREAHDILSLLDYDMTKKMKIVNAILRHSAEDDYYKPINVFDKIISSADALSHYDMFDFLVKMKFKKGLSAEEVATKIKKKYDEELKNKILLPSAKKIAKDKHKFVTEQLKLIVEGTP